MDVKDGSLGYRMEEAPSSLLKLRALNCAQLQRDSLHQGDSWL